MRIEVRHHGKLAELAAAQHGVVSHRQLLGLGYAKAAIVRGRDAGRLHPVHRGVYAVGHRRLSRHGHCLAAVLACGRSALLSHESAGWLWGLLPRFPPLPEVTTTARGHRRGAISIHHSIILEDDDIAVREGVPVTSVPRTLLDLFSRRRYRSGEQALERSERLGLLDLGTVDSLLARCGRHPGRKGLGVAIRLYRDPAFTRSWLERRFLDLILNAGLPRPATNACVEGFELDMYWERERFAVELDGYEYHRDRASFESDRRRQEELKLAGIEMVRFTARRVASEPGDVARRLSCLLRSRRQELR
jgi:very-short-patch-repair endonuclease